MKISIDKFTKLFLLINLFTITFLTAIPANLFSNSISHPNGKVAWNGNLHSSFYHDNGRMAWGGPKFHDNCCYFDSGEKAWKGFLREECSNSVESSYVFHRNQKIAWRGAMRKETPSFIEACYFYHSNGTIAWRGALRKETPSFIEACYIYHSNGTIAWRGAFVKDKADSSVCKLFYDNGQLAWSGKRGDPLFDRDGKQIDKSAEAVNLPLGEGSWLYVSSEGDSILYLSIGDGSFLSFANQNENPSPYLCI